MVDSEFRGLELRFLRENTLCKNIAGNSVNLVNDTAYLLMPKLVREAIIQVLKIQDIKDIHWIVNLSLQNDELFITYKIGGPQ